MERKLNRFHLSFAVTARDVLRYTPAGLAVSEGEGWHCSRQQEAGGTRETDFRFRWIAMGETARAMDALPLGVEIDAEGFVAARRKGGQQLRFHLVAVRTNNDDERKAR